MSTSAPRARRQLRPLARIGIGEKVSWTDAGGTQIQLCVADVRQILPHGKYPATDGEILLFLHQARSMAANPFLRDVHLIKYSPSDPAAIVTGYHFLMATAKGNPAYRGFQQWFVNRDGKRIPDGLADESNVVAAICEVYMQGYDHPVRFVAPMKEFNKGQALWKTMAVFMLGKCSVGGGHRLADPGLAGMYLTEEVGQGYVAPDDVIDGEVITSEPAAATEPQPEPTATASDEEAPTGLCPVHGVAFVRRVGTHKSGPKKGEPYDFWACPKQVGKTEGGKALWCTEKPSDTPERAAPEATTTAPGIPPAGGTPPSAPSAPAPAPAVHDLKLIAHEMAAERWPTAETGKPDRDLAAAWLQRRFGYEDWKLVPENALAWQEVCDALQAELDEAQSEE